jgi:DNA-binding transcriptional ArsR family regulator
MQIQPKGRQMGTPFEKVSTSRSFEEAVSYAVGHRIRVEIIVALHDLDTASAIELSRIVHQPLSTVTHHLRELLKAGSIHIDRTEKVKSVNQHHYKLINPLFYTDEEMQALSEEERKEVTRVVLQGLTAEALASFWAGYLHDDPRSFLGWNWFNVDARGREDIADEQARSWRRIREIEEEATARCEESGAERTSIVVAGLGFKRSRPAARRENEGFDAW